MTRKHRRPDSKKPLATKLVARGFSKDGGGGARRY